MMFDSDDDEKVDPTKIKRSAAGLKSIFASDDRTKQSGSQSLRYEGPKGGAGAGTSSADDFNFNQPAKNNNPGAPPVPAAGASTIACNGAIHAYKGDHPIGAAAIVIASSAAAGTVCVIIDREKRHLCRVKVNSEQFQLLPNPQQRQYATLYDAAWGGHWTLAFKGVPECNAFLVGALTVQHFLLLPDGPRPPVIELAVANQSGGPLIKKNDVVQISLSVWLLAKKGSMTSIGKLVDEIVDEAPRRVTVGDGSVMSGVEDALIGMGVGGRKIVFVPPKKTKQNGLGNPEIGPNDTVVALVSVAGVEPYDPSMGLEDAQRSAAQAHQHAALRQQQQQQQQQRERGMSTTARSGGRGADLVHHNQSASASGSVVAPAPTDTNALLQAFLLKTLTDSSSDSGNKKKKKKRHSSSDDDDDDDNDNAARKNRSSSASGGQKEAPSGKYSEKALESAAFVERSLAMIQQQLSGLYEKLDRTDISKKLEENNQKIERMVKKAVGKAPTLDVDVEDAGKDREELLAKIEQLKEKAESHKADYYAALETMGKHKEDVVALRNDVQIAIKTGEDKVQELKERHRLEVVDNEVRYRRELERVSRIQFDEGKEKGYNEGFSMGRIEGLTQSGSASTEELREKLAQKESENLEIQSRLVEMEAKQYEERRQALEQQATLQGLIDRLEQRNANKEKSVVDQGAMNAKFLRRVMNSTYAHIEEQFYATEKETIPVADALSMVLIAVKSETRQAADELKKLAIIQAKEPAPLAPLPFETASTAAVAAEVARKSPRNIAQPSLPSYSSSSTATSGVPMPPPPPPMMMMMRGSSNNNNNNNDNDNTRISNFPTGGSPGASAQDLSAQLENNNDDFDLGNATSTTANHGQQEDTTGSDSGSGGGGFDEDYIQKMLAEYRSQREKELSATDKEEGQQSRELDVGEDVDVSAATGKLQTASPAHTFSHINSQQHQHHRDEPTNEGQDDGASAAHHRDDDYDEQEDEAAAAPPQPATRKPPRPPRAAQEEEEDEW